MRVAAVFAEDLTRPWSVDLPPLSGNLESAPEIASRYRAPYAILAIPNNGHIDLHRIIEECCHGFRHVLLVPDLPGLCSLGICAREIGGEVGFEVPQRLFHQGAAILKRTLDLAGVAAVSILAFPLLLLIAALVKLTSRGPVFFRQERFGRNGKTFEILKFRTMVADSEKALANYLQQHPDQLSEWQHNHKLKNDPRVTSIGKWLRRFSLDELPQLLNVLVGDMSLVGPRPISKAEIAKYGTGYSLYIRVLPGVTGLWQVSGRNDTTYPERVALDEYYSRNWSVWLDAYIMLRTINTVLLARGAY